jgi:hypothetical protein
MLIVYIIFTFVLALEADTGILEADILVLVLEADILDYSDSY